MSELFPDAELFRLAAARPEHELLLLCAHRGSPPAIRERVTALARSTNDWDYLFLLARRHAVLPLLYKGLENVDGVRRRLSCEGCAKSFARTRRATRSLPASWRDSRDCSRQRAPLLAYKGPALALAAFGDITLRRYVDLDVIVRHGDARRAGELLHTLGYSKPEGLDRVAREVSAAAAAQPRLHARRRADDRRAALGGRARAFAAVPIGEGVWERASAVKLFGTQVRCPSPEDLLLALAVHGTKHLWARLAWVCDVAALVNSQADFDWPYVRSAPARRASRACSSLVLRLARGLAGPRLPEGLVNDAEAKPCRGLAAEVTAVMLFDGVDYVPIGFVSNVRFNLRARPGPRERLDYLRFILTPTDGDLSAVPLPAGMSFAYYLLRPLRLALEERRRHIELGGGKRPRTGLLNLSTPLTLMFIYVSFRLPVRIVRLVRLCLLRPSCR